ncbi:MAG TPA: 23S rRNA (adenine(2503)-C(2))-methyltransferase RlmN [Deltaproteobacteria bacterium]|nr:23S rRNA (adenine(2503)-C(2))-methyltransferase RlmN [Deltaproteobacteria bacterium]
MKPSEVLCVDTTSDKPDLKNMTLDEIESFIAGLGKQKYRAQQIMKWMHQAGVTSFDEMSNLSKTFRAEIESQVRISSLIIEKIQASRDGTKKILFRLEDNNCIESVLIREKNHWTLCMSTQVGCQMGCRFCLTGKGGFTRNLLPSEIVDQITMARFNTPEGDNIKNIVMMGMGEPLANYKNTVQAIKIITNDYGPAVSPRKVTVSTCGIVPMIEHLGNDTPVNLAVSLNASDNETRNMLMPINRIYPIESLIEACRTFPMPRRRRITFEYILIAGVNDSPNDAERLARIMKGVPCKFNLIPFNEYPESEFTTPGDERIDAFQNVLIKHRYTAVTRKSKGRDILAACGQLRGQVEKHENVS